MTTNLDLLGDHLIDLAKKQKGERMRGFVFDPKIGGYRNRANGRKIAESRVRSLGENYIRNAGRANISGITERFIQGKIDLPTWQGLMSKEIKAHHQIMATLGRGGRNAMTPADWGRLGGRLRFQYSRLNQFAEEIRQGRLTAGQIRFRADMYANSSRTSYYDGLTAAKHGAEFTEEMRVLGHAEHCEDCPPIAGYWAPIGSLPAIGATACVTNCHCTKVFRKIVIGKDGQSREVRG